MALPQLNTTPKYELIIPSTGKKARFRPFLVKEQKVLMIAFESKDKRAIIQAMLDTIGACVEEVNPLRLTTFDVDYVFTQLRAKSVGESIDLNIDCNECETPNEVKVNLEEVKLKLEKRDMEVQITKDIAVKLKYPDYNFFIRDPKTLEDKTQTESIIDIIVSCIESVQTGDENISIADEPREEVEKFIDSLTSAQFEKISEFVQNLPKLSHDIKFKCVNCQHDNTRTLEGLEDFF
jgi:hypothetical protein